jgi:neutral trehalase
MTIFSLFIHKYIEKIKNIHQKIKSVESASSPLVGFGWFNDNVIKGLTRLLSVDRKWIISQVLNESQNDVLLETI